jgi:8-amino-7-oxononanoate synthase
MHNAKQFTIMATYSKERSRMPALDDVLRRELEISRARHMYRQLHITTPHEGVCVVRDGRERLNFCSNDYLGLAAHPEVIRAAREASSQGVGARASRLVCGEHPYFSALESALAQHKGTPAALVFGSGYLANLGVITALVGKGDLILADKLVHACMLDGARLSGAKLLRFAHQDMAEAARMLAASRSQYRHCLIVSETLFSMDGDRADVAALLALAEAHDAWCLLDDAHGTYSPLEKLPCDPRLIQIGTLSKSLGSYGGYVCGSEVLREFLIGHARSFIFSTGLPAPVVAAATAALQLIHAEPQRTTRPLELATQFCAMMGMPSPQGQIVPLVVGESEKALALAEQLYQHGILVSAIRPPTVPQGAARLRFTFSAAHSADQLERLVSVLRPLLAG